jgi:ATP/maltotriose-dependent transcriptional regulator MalT/DNA-binding SARP family transcriptional activator
VVRTKLTPPRLPRHTLSRPRLTRRLLAAEEYRLTVVQAGTGYGKSTALAALPDAVPTVWYHLDADDADPLVFLLHLVHGFSAAVADLSAAPLARLEEWERSGGDAAWETAVDALVNELAQRDQAAPLFLVLDDAHVLRQAGQTLRALDRLIGRAPAHLHVILSTRYPVKLPSLVRWQIRGELLEIGESELAFTTDETVALFRDQFNHCLTDADAATLMARVEGWPIALPLVWQRLQRDAHASLADALGELSGAGGNLFTYLAQEVLQQQPPDVQHFLRATAVLRQMTPAICDCVRERDGSAQLLDYLVENGLFVVDMGDGHVRYHHLFRDLLLHQLSPRQAAAAHRRAAHCHQQRGDAEEAVDQLLAAGDDSAAAALLVQLGRDLVRAGRLDRLATWIGSLPPDLLQAHPPLLAYLGDVARLRSRFDEALGWYQQAEAASRNRGELRSVGQALRGQARVYLDTVNPSRAEDLLQEALRLSDGQEDRESRARLLELLAENLVNQGKSEPARAYQEEARALREQASGEAALSIRVLLRTGRLAEARQLLTARLEEERRQPVLRPRAHRETPLLLSLVAAFQGQRREARACALEGTDRGERLNSPFVTAVGYMRQGHASLLRKDSAGYAEAVASFRRAIAISDEIGVPRLKVEASWGLGQAYGFRGELELAEEAAQQGIAIARNAGDEWVEACIRVTLGAAYFLAGDERAAQWLGAAGAAFHVCGDTYGEAVVRLWQCLQWQREGDTARLARDVDELLRLVRAHGYDYLFQRRTLVGPPDPRATVPLLLFARDSDGPHAGFGARLLATMGLARLETHPGYQLRVQALGPFRLWRGAAEVPAGEWTRRKARELFHLMLTFRHTQLEREQMTDMLWPELDPEAAQRDFKIAYSALCRVLEPERQRNAPSAFIHRDGSRYGLRPEADLWLDAAEFEAQVNQGDRLYAAQPGVALDHLRKALRLYEGDFLQEYPYAEWASEERERLLTTYLRAAERLASALAQRGEWQETIDVCQAILARDDCWEQAYRLLMAAHAQLGNRTQALRAYQRCVDRLQAELGVAPMPATQQLHAAIVAGAPLP